MSSSQNPTIVWLRRDLRISDHPALAAALALGRPVLALWILDEETSGLRPPGGASRWWLSESLEALRRDLADRNIPLVLRKGGSSRILLDLVEQTGAGAVFWNRVYLPGEVERDRALKAHLTAKGISARSWSASLLVEPWEVAREGRRHRTFTSFWNDCRTRGINPVLLDRAGVAPRWPDTMAVPASDALQLTPVPDWASGMRQAWHPGERGAQARLKEFLATILAGYETDRDRMALDGTSRLSPHLAWGEISPGQVWRGIADAARRNPRIGAAASAAQRQLGWREFAWHTAFYVPDLAGQPLDLRNSALPWNEDPALLQAWARGRTGIPLVDAGMRQLWRTGWMHNRTRMLCGSMLSKFMLVRWQAGEAWFWDTLVDADPALNAFNWQWVSGAGADPAPYVRLLSPIRQAERFDADGAYIRRWVPELAGLETRYLCRPWDAPDASLRSAGITLGKTYPRPIIDLREARLRAVELFGA